MMSRRGLKVKIFDEVVDEGQRVVAETGTWESRRYFTRKDGFGFSLHHTILYAGRSTLIWYKNHYEAVFVFKGRGSVEKVKPGQKQGEGVCHPLEPGTAYLLDDPATDRHYLSASEDGDMEVVCAFNPPIDGAEDHNDDGVYPMIGDDGVARYDTGLAKANDEPDTPLEHVVSK
jgi:L-ectoine synthase